MSAEFKRLPGSTLIDADFLKHHFPNAPVDVRLEWYSTIKRQALYSIGDLQFISEQTWKDMALPGLVRDKLQALSGWGQAKKTYAPPSSTSPQRSRPPPSKDSSGIRPHSPQREHKDRGRSPQRSTTRSPHREKSDQKPAETRPESKLHRSKDTTPKESHSRSGSKTSLSSSSKSHSSSSPSSSHKSREKTSRSRDTAKPSSSSSSSSATPSSVAASSTLTTSTSANAKAVTTEAASKSGEGDERRTEDWSDNSEGDSSSENAPDIIVHTLSASASASPPITSSLSVSTPTVSSSLSRPVVTPQPAAALPTPSAFAAASTPTPAGRPETKMRPLFIGKRVDERPASPLSPTHGSPTPLRTSGSATALPATTPPTSTNWMAARDSGGPGSRASVAAVSPAGRSSQVGVPAIIGRRAEGSSEKLSVERSKLTGSAILREAKPAPTKEEKQKRLGHIRAELFTTEKVYVQDLHTIHTVFFLPMQQQKIISDALLNKIFINTSSLIGLGKVLLDDITKCMDTNQGFGDCFLRMSEFMKMYSQYCSNYDASIAALAQEIKTNARLVEFLKKQPLLKLDALLIKPVQRLCRYPLLLREMLKQMDPSESDYATLEQACTAIEAVIGKVNENKREFEIMQKVQRFRLRLTNAHYLDLMAPTRQFVREGTLRMVGTAKQKDTTVWLFSDILIVCRPAKMADGQPDPEHLKLKASPPLHIAQVAEIPDGTIPEVSGAFQVSWEAMDGQPIKLVFYTWPEEKDLWVTDLASNIEERRKAKAEEKKAGSQMKPLPRAVSPQMRERPQSSALRGPGIRRSSSLQTFQGF